MIALNVKAGFAKSNGEARRSIAEGGFYVNDEAVKDIYAKLSKAELAKGDTMIRRGKKQYRKIVVE